MPTETAPGNPGGLQSNDFGQLFFATHFPRFVVALLLLLWVGIPDGAAQQSKPNLSGTWKLIPAKTMHPRWWHETKDYSCVIEAVGSKIWMTHIDQRGIETEVYFTDGKEHIASPLDQKDQVRAKTYWDGNILVVEKRREEGGLGGSVWTSRYELSGRRKVPSGLGTFPKVFVLGRAF